MKNLIYKLALNIVQNHDAEELFNDYMENLTDHTLIERMSYEA